MERKIMSKEEVLEKQEELLKKYYEKSRKSAKQKILSKKEKKYLGIGKDESKAILRYARIAPRKAKIVIDLIKNKGLDEAYAILKYTPKAASEILYKLIKSAEANAVNRDVPLDRDELYIAELYANQGPTMKRIMPRAQGRAYRIRKRTSHITVVLKERKKEVK